MAEDLKKFTNCPVCFERLIPPVVTCQNGHAICQDCRRKLKTCFSCKGNFTANKNTFLDQMLESIPVTCKYKASGCESEILIKNIKEHESDCYYKEKQCSCCHQKFSYCELKDHFKQHYTAKGMAIHLLKNYEICMDFTSFQGSYIICYASDIDEYFLHRFSVDWEKKTMIFVVHFLGNREDASKYFFNVVIDQNSPTEDKKFFSFSGICIPYCYLKSDYRNNRRAITWKLNEIFLSDECPEKWNLQFCIYQVKY